MSVAELLQAVQFVVKPDGRPAAVQMDMPTWEALLAWLEEGEDRQMVKTKLERLRQGPGMGGALRWDEARADWEAAEKPA
jgi:hypothetical protein